MSQKVSIILARAFWCGHCQHFELIYNKLKDIYKEFDFFKDIEIKFEDYDIANQDIKNTFIINHYDIKDKIEGYPTVYINLKNKTEKTNQYFPIEHTVIDEKIKDKDEQYKEAGRRFLESVINVLKSYNSDNKILYIQKGGNKCELKQNIQEDIYKKKYQKYKSKYLKLKI